LFQATCASAHLACGRRPRRAVAQRLVREALGADAAPGVWPRMFPSKLLWTTWAATHAIFALMLVMMCNLGLVGWGMIVGLLGAALSLVLGVATCLVSYSYAVLGNTPARPELSQDTTDRLAAKVELIRRVCPERVFDEADASGLRVCVVCLQRMFQKEACRRLSCGHAFHAGCIDRWWLQSAILKLRCPVCRQEHPKAAVSHTSKRAKRHSQNSARFVHRFVAMHSTCFLMPWHQVLCRLCCGGRAHWT